MGKIVEYLCNTMIVLSGIILVFFFTAAGINYFFPETTMETPRALEVTSVEGPKSLLITHTLDGKDFKKFDRLNITIKNPYSGLGSDGLSNQKVDKYEIYDAKIWIPRKGKKHYPEELQPYFSNNQPEGVHAQVLLEEVMGKCYIDFYVKGNWIDEKGELEELKYKYSINIQKVSNDAQ